MFTNRELLMYFGLAVLLSSGHLLPVSATSDDRMNFYKDAKSMEERAHQELDKAR